MAGRMRSDLKGVDRRSPREIASAPYDKMLHQAAKAQRSLIKRKRITEEQRSAQLAQWLASVASIEKARAKAIDDAMQLFY